MGKNLEIHRYWSLVQTSWGLRWRATKKVFREVKEIPKAETASGPLNPLDEPRLSDGLPQDQGKALGPKKRGTDRLHTWRKLIPEAGKTEGYSPPPGRSFPEKGVEQDIAEPRRGWNAKTRPKYLEIQHKPRSTVTREDGG